MSEAKPLKNYKMCTFKPKDFKLHILHCASPILGQSFSLITLKGNHSIQTSSNCSLSLMSWVNKKAKKIEVWCTEKKLQPKMFTEVDGLCSAPQSIDFQLTAELEFLKNSYKFGIKNSLYLLEILPSSKKYVDLPRNFSKR